MSGERNTKSVRAYALFTKSSKLTKTTKKKIFSLDIHVFFLVIFVILVS